MKILNQFDSSIRFISKEVPVIIRKAYEKFVDVNAELIAKLEKANVEQPSTVDILCKTLLKVHTNISKFDEVPLDVLSAIKSISVKCESITLMNVILNSSEIQSCETVEENCPDSPDLFAPLTVLKLGITNVPTKEQIKGVLVPSVVIQPTDSYKFISKPDGYSSPVTVNDHLNNLGFKTIMDDMKSECIIDVYDLFAGFLHQVMYNNVLLDDKSDLDVNGLEMYKSVYTQLTSTDTMNRVIDVYSKQMIKTVIATYLMFAGKIRGIKSDLCSWMYTFFIKDSMRDVEKGDYPTTSDITLQAGMQTMNDRLDLSKPTRLDSKYNNAGDKKNIDSNRYKIRMYNGNDATIDSSIFYKNIRLLYSNWSAVMNTIIDISNSYNYDRPATEEDFAGHSCPTELRSVHVDHIAIARALLGQYLRCRFRTYNSTYHLVMDKQGHVSCEDLLKIGINTVYDAYNKEIIKEYCVKNESSYIHRCTDHELDKVLNSTRAECCVLADKFMATAYLIMLDYIHTHQEQIISQDDEGTGKNNRELFEEIYFKLKDSIYSFIWDEKVDVDTNIIVFGKKDMVVATMNADSDTGAIPRTNSTNYSLFDNHFSDFEKENDGFVSDEFNKVNSYIKNAERAAGDMVEMMVYNYCVIPPASDSGSVKAKLFDVTPDKISPFNQFQTRTNSLFPKNQVILERLAKMRIDADKPFTSIESCIPSDFDNGVSLEDLNSVCDNVESSVESEWAHMCYSDLGAIGGKITDLEIECEETASCPTTETSSIEDPLIKEQQMQSVKEAVATHDVDISKGVIADKDPKDSDYIKNVTSSTEGYSELVARYNKIFNKIILGV